MRAIVPALLIGSLTFAAIIYLNASNSNLFSFITPQTQTTYENVDGSADVRSREKRINALLIPSANKNDLLAGKPFWGAAQHMVELAFNAKSTYVIVNARDKQFYEFQTFEFGGMRGTIILEFRDNKLICIHTPATQKTTCQQNAQSYYGNAVPFHQLSQ